MWSRGHLISFLRSGQFSWPFIFSFISRYVQNRGKGCPPNIRTTEEKGGIILFFYLVVKGGWMFDGSRDIPGWQKSIMQFSRGRGRGRISVPVRFPVLHFVIGPKSVLIPKWLDKVWLFFNQAQKGCAWERDEKDDLHLPFYTFP